MSEIIGHNGNVLFFGGLPVGFVRPIYHVYVLETSHGTVTVNHSEGPSGTLVTISAAPDTGYVLDTITLTGAELINDNQFYINGSDVFVDVAFAVNYNPLNLPANTVRVRTNDGNPPTSSVSYTSPTFESATLVSGTSDVYDVYKSGTSLLYLLQYCSNVVEVLGANTSNVKNMSHMFYECSSLTSVPLFDTSNVTAMVGMFRECRALTSVPLYDTSKVTNMSYMFENCRLTDVPLFNTSNVTDMSYMFHYGHLRSVPLFDTSKVTTMRNMFDSCPLTTVPLFDTSKVTNMNRMFYNCIDLITVPLFDTSKVTDMRNMFSNCWELTSVPVFNTSSVTEMEEMFERCVALTAVPLFNTSNVTNMRGMFANCYKVESGALALYQQASSQANPPSSHEYAFGDCGRDTETGAAELAQIPSGWK